MSLKHELQLKELEKRVATLENLFSNASTAKTYEAIHKAFGWYDVTGPEGVILSGVRKDEAFAKVKELGG